MNPLLLPLAFVPGNMHWEFVGMTYSSTVTIWTSSPILV
jgi:hypothetical protein